MANTLKFIDMVAREALAIAHEKCTFIGTTDRQYDDSFGKTGAKIGSSLRVRNPNQYVRRTGSRVMDVQDQNESVQTITVATQDGVDMRFNSAEMVLDTDNPSEVAAFSKRYIEPAISVLASGIEGDYLAFATKRTAQTVGQGSAGAIGTALTNLTAPGLARSRMNRQLAPMGNRNVQMDSNTMAGLVSGVAAYFAPTAAIGEQYREGMIARTAMADYYENERVWTMATGGTGDDIGEIDESTETNFVEGATTIHIDGMQSTTTISVGAVFTWEGLYDCHPETKAAYPSLKQFTVTAISGISGADADITFLPAIYTTGARKNVVTSTGGNVTWTQAGQDNKDVTFAGAVSSTYVTSLMYHKDAFQFITADLPLMDDAHKCTRRTQDGLSMRVWMASDIRNDELLMRLDILYGMAALRPEWACRIVGAAS